MFPEDSLEPKRMGKPRNLSVELQNNHATLDVEKLAFILTKLRLTYEERLFLITTFIEYSKKFRSPTIELGIFELCVKERIMYIHRAVKNITRKFLPRARVEESILEEAVMKRVIASFFPIRDGDEQFIHNLLIDMLETERKSCFSEVMLQMSAYFTVNESDDLSGKEYDFPLEFKDAEELLSDGSGDIEQ
jgi:hypothetical protein